MEDFLLRAAQCAAIVSACATCITLYLALRKQRPEREAKPEDQKGGTDQENALPS